MNLAGLFPWAIIVLNVGAALSNLARGDASRAIYWSAAAILNLVITLPSMRLPWFHN